MQCKYERYCRLCMHRGWDMWCRDCRSCRFFDFVGSVGIWCNESIAGGLFTVCNTCAVDKVAIGGTGCNVGILALRSV